jgi:hypothetical protein
MKKDFFNRKNVLLLMLMVGVFLLLGSLGAGVVYLSGIGTKSQYSTVQGNFKSTHTSSVEQSSKGGSKVSKSEVAEKQASKKKTATSTNPCSSSEQLGKVANSKQEAQAMTTTEQESHVTVTSPVTYVATYKGFTGYSTVSYDEALSIARSLSENQKLVIENTQEVIQQPTQESVQQELEKTIASIQAQDPNTQINIIK